MKDRMPGARLKLIQGTVDLLILRALTGGPRHGYSVSSWIRERSGGELGLDEAALYQALHRLERRGLVASEWGLSDNNRRAKYYEITRKGRRHLTAEVSTWQRYARAVSSVLEST
jgi:PadR family transcriptional regulator, regulatory protein PadR